MSSSGHFPISVISPVYKYMELYIVNLSVLTVSDNVKSPLNYIFDHLVRSCYKHENIKIEQCMSHETYLLGFFDLSFKDNCM